MKTLQDKMREAIAKTVDECLGIHVEYDINIAAARCAEIAEESKYISVDEALPEVGEYVLVLLNNENAFKGKLYHNGWAVFYKDGEHAVPEGDVTHWQPLPSLPQKPKE